MRLIRGISVLLSGVLLLGGCDSPAGADDPAARTVSFDFQGARSGAFQLQGPPAAGGPHAGSYVTGEYKGISGIFISGFRLSQAPVGDQIYLEILARKGTHSCTCPEGSSDCARIYGRFGTDPTRSTWRPGEERFYIGTCTVTLDELTPERARGTFSAAGRVYWKVEGDSIMEGPLTITNGRFDAELHPE